MDNATNKTTKAKGNPTDGKKPRKQKKGKSAKVSKPKTESAPKEPMVVFAFRLTKAQRDIIHKAAGPGKATRFVRAAALAAAEGDRSAFDQLLKK